MQASRSTAASYVILQQRTSAPGRGCSLRGCLWSDQLHLCVFHKWLSALLFFFLMDVNQSYVEPFFFFLFKKLAFMTHLAVKTKTKKKNEKKKKISLFSYGSLQMQHLTWSTEWSSLASGAVATAAERGVVARGGGKVVVHVTSTRERKRQVR